MANFALNFTDLTKQADNYYDVSYKWLTDKNVPAWLAVAVSGFTAATNMILPVALAVAIQGVLGIGQFFATSVLQVIGSARENNSADFNEVIAASTNELLGTDLSASDLPGGNSGSPGIGNQTALGDAVLRQFEEALAGGGEITPEQGAENARKFTGFAVNFATSQAFLSILTEAASVGIMKEFHELPEALQTALGLGRLTRLALQPLIRNCIQQPYDLMLKYKLRPDRLNAAQVVRAFHAKQLDEGDAQQALAEMGYRDNDIDLLMQDLKTKVALGELVHLIIYEELTEEQALEKLTNAGYQEDDARLLLKSALAARADGQVSGILADLERDRLAGFLDQGEYDSLVSELPLTEEQDRLFRKKVADQLERPRKKTTFAQVKNAIVQGHVDFTYLDEWLIGEGYGDQDVLILEMEVIDAMQLADAKARAKQKTAAKTSAKGITPPTTLAP
jgi:hypothetical protein